MDTLRLTLRVDLGSDRLLGPGKIRLLEAIEKTGSISQAGRMLGMSPASRARTRLHVRASYLDWIGARPDLLFRDIVDFRLVLIEGDQGVDPPGGNLVELGKPLVTDCTIDRSATATAIYYARLERNSSGFPCGKSLELHCGLPRAWRLSASPVRFASAPSSPPRSRASCRSPSPAPWPC